MPRYHVFLPPPSPESLRSAAKRQWLRGEIALEHESEARVMEDTKLDEDSQIYWDEFSSISSWGALGYGPMGGESVQLASQRLSTLYEGVVFRESCEDEYTQSQSQVLGSQASGTYQFPIRWSLITSTERETSFEWSRTQHSIELVPSISGQPPPNSSPQRSQSQFLTSLEESSYSTSPSVIHQLPKFRVPLLSLSPLHAISNGTINTEDSNSKKVSILVAVLDVDGPEYVRITKGVDRGIEVGLLKLVLGSVDGSICRLTVWRERAELWGNLTRRGDVVLFQGTSPCLI